LKESWHVSLGDDVPGGEAELLEASAWRQVHCNGGATVRSGRWFSVVLWELFVKKNETERGWWRRNGGREAARVSEGSQSGD
jgi:hypothetical protein